MRSNKPYCLFKSDIWQLGCTFLGCFQRLEKDIPQIIKLLEVTRADFPDAPSHGSQCGSAFQ
ncbi:hypothetical protein PILCRDRAFT_822765 [Piloderma croceum F 1598]|uniref:Uncharacterized protein n=1 Tax=Piloderma croceum (strain F 1598) TaxID=765440 RepID=A0A0C3B219_PILCF|nr:hypothetical protein PILCRDRAFT_822765 [Piloderma croceum F 1598]